MNTFDAPKKNGNGKQIKAASTGGGLEHRQILSALRAFKRGDFSIRMREDLTGVDGQIAETFNELVELVKSIRDEVSAGDLKHDMVIYFLDFPTDGGRRVNGLSGPLVLGR